MTTTSDGRNALAEIVAGLDGVTPGPWYPGHLGGDGSCQCRSIVDDGQYCGAIATVHVSNGLPIGEGGNDAPSAGEAAANMHHIARCNPATLHSIAALVAAQDDKIAAMEADHRVEIAAMAEQFRAVNVDRVLEQMQPDTVALLRRATAAEAQIAALQAQIERMREALAPFAKEAEHYRNQAGGVLIDVDDYGTVRDAEYSISDLRRARFLSQSETGE